MHCPPGFFRAGLRSVILVLAILEKMVYTVLVDAGVLEW